MFGEGRKGDTVIEKSVTDIRQRKRERVHIKS